MRNRYYLLIVGLLCCMSVFGMGEDGKIPAISNQSDLPGGYKIEQSWGSKSGRKTWWRIPSDGNMINCYFDDGKVQLYFNEKDFDDSVTQIKISYPDILYQWKSFHYHLDGVSGSIQSVSIVSDIEWTADDKNYPQLWSPNPRAKTYEVKDQKSPKNGYQYDWSANFESKALTIFTQDVWNKAMQDNNVKARYEKYGYVDIYFRIAFKCCIHYELWDEDEADFCAYFHTQDVSLRVYKCNPGELSVQKTSESKNPKIIYNGKVTGEYAIYEKQDFSVDLVSTIERSSVNSEVKDIIKDKFEKQITNAPFNGELNNSISISEFKEESFLKPGTEYEVSRKIITSPSGTDQKLSCESNKLKFIVLPEPTLEPLKGEKEKVICKGKTPQYLGINTIENELANTDEFITLAGGNCIFGKSDQYKDYSETYGVVYRWYITTNYNGSPQLLPLKQMNDQIPLDLTKKYDVDNDNNGPDLTFPLYSLSEGVTYRFYQRVYFKNFGDKYIESKEYYEVKLSKTIDPKTLSIEMSEKEVCEGDNLMDVVFQAQYGQQEDPKAYGMDDFNYVWKINGVAGEGNEVYEIRNFDRVSKDITYEVSLSDGCGNTIKKEAKIHVNALPSFTAENIKNSNNNISLTIKDDGSIKVIGLKNRECKLEISDSEKNTHDYFYSLYDDGSELVALSGTTYKETSLQGKTIYFYKKSKSGEKCLSNPVKVELNALSDLEDNTFLIKEIYVCEGSYVPELNSNNGILTPTMSGVDSKNIEYSWEYSTDNMNWYKMTNVNEQGDESYFTKSNYDGTWKREIKSTTYIRRVATPKLSDGTVLGNYESDTLTVNIYSKPSLTLKIDGSLAVDPKCYGDNIKLSMSINNSKLADEEKVMSDFNGTSCLSRYGYYDFDGEKYTALKTFTDINDANAWQKDVTRNYNIYSGVEYCGDTIFSNPIFVETHEQIDVTPTLGPCKVVGNEVTITAVKDGHTCEIRRGEETFPAVDGVSTAKILLDSKKDYKYEVEVTNDETGCKAVLSKSIPASEVLEKNTSVSIGPSGDASNTTICAGTKLTIKSSVTEDLKQPWMRTYSWSVNNKIQTGETEDNLVFTADAPGTEYTIERTRNYYEQTTFCYSVVDKTTLITQKPLVAPTIALSSDSICNGEQVVITATANGGGSESEYYLYCGETQSNIAVKKGGKYEFKTTPLTKDTTISVYVTDNTCSNGTIYKATSEKTKVVVEKDLAFTINPSQKIITSDDYTEDVTVRTISIQCVGAEENDTLYYKLNGGEETKVIYNGSGFSIKISKAMFDESVSVELEVRRVGSSVGKCESTSFFKFRLDEGFEGAPLLEKDGKQEIEICEGETLDLEVTGVENITFNGAAITEMDNWEWILYKGNSIVDRVSKKDEKKPNFELENLAAGTTNRYYVVFKGEDAGGTVRRVSSNDFIVKCGLGVNVGNIHFDEYQNQTFVEFCENSDKTVPMSGTMKAESVKSMQWKYNMGDISDENDWKDVPENVNNSKKANTNNITVVLSELVNNLRGEEGKMTTDRVYFRLYATDNCDSESMSDNILLIRFKTNVDMPKPSLSSAVMYGSEVEFPDSLLFSRHWSHSDPYEYLRRGEVADLGGSLQRVYFKDLQFGENSVDVVRSEKARISEELCYSDTLQYTFNIYQKLKTPTLAVNPSQDYYCAKDGEKKNLYLNKIVGGDTASYKTVWQYQMEGIDEWIAMDNGENYGVFNVTIGKIKENEVNEHQQQIIIKDLSQSIKVRAMLTCGGDYPGGYVSSNEVSLNVYAPMKDGGIDFSEKEICYNTPIDEIKGFEAEGGSGRYSYVWQKSTDKSNYVEMDNGKANNPSLIVKNFNGEQNLKKTTYFRRIVTDEVCGTKDTSEVKTVFVTDDFQITAEDVEYSHVVSNRARARMVGVTDFSKSGTDDIQYVWYKSGSASAIVYEESAVSVEVQSESLEVPKGDDGYTATYYVQAIKEGCKSSNKLELNIYVYNQTGGTLSLDGHDSSEEVIWVCSGEEDLNVFCDGSAPNADYEWYYMIDDDPKLIKGVYNGKTTSKVTTADVRLDTTNMTLTPFPLRNTMGGKKKVKIFRVTNIDELNLTLFSDTLTINIVPTLESVSNALFTNSTALAGEIEIKTGKKDYCIGDEPNRILGYIDPDLGDYWDHYKEYLGPWLYDKSIVGGFKTYYEYQINEGEWIKEIEYDYSKKNEYAGMDAYSIGEYLDGSYRIHRVLEDGCSSMTSNEVLMSLFDKVLDVDTVSTYAYTPEMKTFNPNNAIRSGYEVGDSIVFTSKDKNLDLVWYSDPQCTEVLADGKSYCGMRLTEELANEKEGEGAYIYVRARRGDCFGEIVAVPFEFGTLSDGGTIYISESIICHNGLYEDIIGEGEAKGQYKAPVYGPMQWSYSWQYKRSESDKATWSTIADETGLGLSADVINDLSATANSSDSPLLIRRVATNDKGRVRYSNVLTLTRYSVLMPGVLSLNGDQNSFCTYDELSYVKTTDPSGGKANGNYGLIWQYNVNNGEWKDFVCSDSLYIGHIAVELDRKINNNVNFRCKYTDDCESVFSNEVTVTLFRINESPTFYQNNDSCNAEVVKLLVNKEEIQKTYHWSAIYIDPEDDTYTEKTIWNYVGEDCMIVRNGMPTTTYAVRSEDNETKCLSKLYYFDVDSLPDLTQNSFEAPIAICDGSDLEIKGGVVSGGNGEKTYQWQMSSTGNDNDFADIVDATSNDLSLSAKYMKTGSYFRRIVVDMCDTDTSDVIFVDVRQKVSVSSEDLAFDDFKCPNGIFTAKVVAVADSTMLSEYWTLDNDTIFTIGKNFQMEGFAGDSMEYQFVHYLTDTTGLTCKSEAVGVYAYNKPSINKEENIISTDNYTPCNESQVKIEGSLLGGSHSEHIKYNWYVNGNEQIGEFKNNLRFTANDDMVVVRIADNGCVTDSSNVLHLEGQIVFAYDYANELSMEVLTDVSDSSVVINILGSKLFSEGYEFTGDGDMPSVASNNIVLPYKFDIYKDSLLGIMAKVPYCVRSLAINPLRGGVISFDGGDQLCGGEEVAPIVVTELEGGSGNPTYQWQYKNERTPDFINIDGATSKSYTPSSVDVATTYRRIAVDGIYKSISNELTLTIKPIPSAALIDNSYTTEELFNLSLLYKTHSYYQWVDNMEMYLIDSAKNADRTQWQVSYDQVDWLNAASDKDSILVTDIEDVAYYRFVAINGCGSDTSSIVKVERRNIEPITDDQIIWSRTDTFICRINPGYYDNYLRFNLVTYNYEGTINRRYLYSYRVESDCNAVAWAPKVRVVDPTRHEGYIRYDSIFTENTLQECSVEIRISEIDGDGNKVMPSDDVTLYVTRHDTLRGTSITRPVALRVNAFDATFAMSIENGPEIRVGENEVNVIRQGDRVQFIPKVTTNIENSVISYDWKIEEPINKKYFSVYGGRNGIDGITSEKESPACYYYNGGYYRVSLEVTDGVCKTMVIDTSLYIPENSLRSFAVPMVMEDDIQDADIKVVDFIDVYPTIVKDWVNVVATGESTHNVMLVDELGRVLQEEVFNGSVRVPMNGCVSGTYFIVVDEQERFKVIKR